MRPISVPLPVATVSARPRPLVTPVPANTIDVRSASALVAATAVAVFGTGADSPVSADSSIRSRSCGDDPRVGRHSVALAKHEQISGHDLLDGDLALAPVADHGRDGSERAPQRENCTLRAGFLNEAEHTVQYHDRRDHAGLQVLSDEKERPRPRREARRAGPRAAGPRSPRRPAARARVDGSGRPPPAARAARRQPVVCIAAKIPCDVGDGTCVRRCGVGHGPPGRQPHAASQDPRRHR